MMANVFWFQTVEETLMLAAHFSLGSSMSSQEKKSYVKSVMNDLGKYNLLLKDELG